LNSPASIEQSFNVVVKQTVVDYVLIVGSHLFCPARSATESLTRAEIDRMASAVEHEDLKAALSLS